MNVVQCWSLKFSSAQRVLAYNLVKTNTCTSVTVLSAVTKYLTKVTSGRKVHVDSQFHRIQALMGLPVALMVAARSLKQLETSTVRKKREVNVDAQLFFSFCIQSVNLVYGRVPAHGASSSSSKLLYKCPNRQMFVVGGPFIQSGLQWRSAITASVQTSITNESLETMCSVLQH